MRIHNETIDDNVFIDFILDHKDIEGLIEKSLQPKILRLGNVNLNLWIRMATDRELYEIEDYENDE